MIQSTSAKSSLFFAKEYYDDDDSMRQMHRLSKVDCYC